MIMAREELLERRFLVLLWRLCMLCFEERDQSNLLLRYLVGTVPSFPFDLEPDNTPIEY